MHTLEIHNFKAFGEDGVVFGASEPDFTKRPKNILCYGENGTGKTSIFEAIRWVFYTEAVINSRVPAALVGAARDNAIRQVYVDHNNRITKKDFSIHINGTDYTTIDKSLYSVSMLTGYAIQSSSRIDLSELYSFAHIGSIHPATILLNEEGELDLIIEEVNRVLKEVFIESIQIEKSQNGPFLITLIDEERDLRQDEFIPYFFNEAKIHLVKLLLLLSSIEVLTPTDQAIHKILVLDDIFTSLDSANRIFIFQYLAERFRRFQIILFTHNVNFFNLAEHLIINHYMVSADWTSLALYESNGQFKIYEKYQLSAKIISDKLQTDEINEHECGNLIRKYFEILLHQLAMLTMVDAKEESKTMLHDIKVGIENRRFFVSEHGVETAADLTAQIRKLIRDVPDKTLRLEKIEHAIQSFDSKAAADVLMKALDAMAIFQKVALHKSSHGHAGLPDLTSKEIKSSLILLGRLEALVNKISMERV